MVFAGRLVIWVSCRVMGWYIVYLVWDWASIINCRTILAKNGLCIIVAKVDICYEQGMIAKSLSKPPLSTHIPVIYVGIIAISQ
jgi:hypothetical protein